jgi:glycine dehydrogenase subunit 1
MPFIPHTKQDTAAMLAKIGVPSIESLFDEIPASLRIDELAEIKPGLTEMEISRLMLDRAAKDQPLLNFMGAGAYEHFIPAAIWDIAQRGEFLTAYTPYQAEASQGTLQLIYEYQTMMASLMGTDLANASLYDGASALAEAILMAVRVNQKSKSRRILVPKTVHPAYRKVIKSLVASQGIVIEELSFSLTDGNMDPASLTQFSGQDITALVIPQPNFFGVLEETDALTSWAHQQNALAIALVNPLSLALLKEPGKWGDTGADIICGEGQALGVPLSSGGPYFGFMGCKQAYIRQMPGRIVGRTIDTEGKSGFTLTLQAREQHIRRSKATSNICTNQGLMVTAATIYLSLLGNKGLRHIASACHKNMLNLRDKLAQIKGGIRILFNRPFFHEAVIQFDKPVEQVLSALAAAGIQGGYSLAEDYPELGQSLLVCATETKTDTDLEKYVQHLEQILQNHTNVVAEII